ncbi:hypothetical protein RFI_25989 [Reticulomyxa filosa]|uniref:AAA+ ATPase domain-containing protein n=1 Tax=Reticulomyxa filosa TaxID=46433 RepID=X6MDA4_RETFI|nr:hypothetical protein RFI_25989 [Reticulomyxa filosa]|eukprot:ETO11387.1 hypothetical protein RFI_25989 [Reticulomyxa filosa]
MKQCLVVSLGICYYFRLKKSERKNYIKEMSTKTENFLDILKKEMKKFSEAFYSLNKEIIAKTEALEEILFMLFICIVTTTPIVLVGDPGTSKTLAFQLLKDRLSEPNIKELQKNLQEQGINLKIKPLHVVYFQCTQESKPFGIKERWEQAQRHSEDKAIKPMLLLDEIGLAERSKHSPLKVLHHLLENPGISLVALSNRPLDAAKMNRVIVHQIPNNLKSDIENIANAILKENTKHTKFSVNEIKLLVRIFDKLDKSMSKNEQTLPKKDQTSPKKDQTSPKKDQTSLCKENWLGRRDFYALIRYHMHHPLPKEALEGIMRNLGGCKNENFQKYLTVILKSEIGEGVLELMNRWGSLKCIEMNLKDEDCRHCLVICNKPYSWQLLLDQNLLPYEDTVFLFESKFASDTATMTSYDHLHKVINCMEAGKKVVLYNLKSIHECLYDMLNQRYRKNAQSVHVFVLFYNYIRAHIYYIYTYIEQFCRMAMESRSKECMVVKQFKCVVIVSEQDMQNSVNH